MMLWGVSIPPLAVAIGTIITAFIAGLGLGMGSETGKYLMEKYLKPKYELLHSNVNKLHKSVLHPLVKKGKPNSKILSKAFKGKKSRTWKSSEYVDMLAKKKTTRGKSKKSK